jgi:hypothetical protein
MVNAAITSTLFRSTVPKRLNGAVAPEIGIGNISIGTSYSVKSKQASNISGSKLRGETEQHTAEKIFRSFTCSLLPKIASKALIKKGTCSEVKTSV